MSWVDHVIWWQVYPLGFLGAEKELGAFQGEVNRLPRLQGWLDHLISWGGNGLLLGPIFTSSSSRLRHRRLLPDRSALG